ncbi:MAG: M23 family metallopeptidase [Candidatus Cloacimonetes bacterium]|nr:M23 family metallopeptidase [Candidatus Cloacimonadota bacterium]
MKNLFLLLLLVVILITCTHQEELIEIEPPDPYEHVIGRLKTGKSLYSVLLDNNVSYQDAYKITKELNSIYDLRYSHPNDSFHLKIDTLGIVQVIEYSPNKIEKYIVARDSTDEFEVFHEKLVLEKEVKLLTTILKSSLYETLINGGLDPQLVMKFSDIFQWDIDFFIDPREGDTCSIVYEAYSHDGEILQYGEILGASYKGKLFDLTAYYFDNGNNIHGYYNEYGESFQKAFLRSPLNYSFISSYFGMRLHPITKQVWLHNGVDYAAPLGTPVASSADGTVIHKGWKGGHPTPKGNTGGYGYTVMIRHSNGYKTLYGHLSSYAKNLYVGKRVVQGEIIGYVGSTGWSTGPHLHYTIYHHDAPINPLSLNNVSGPPIPKEYIDTFNESVHNINTLLEQSNKTFLQSIFG